MPAAGSAPAPAPAAEKPAAAGEAKATGADVVVLTDATFQEKVSKGVWLIKLYVAELAAVI